MLVASRTLAFTRIYNLFRAFYQLLLIAGMMVMSSLFMTGCNNNSTPQTPPPSSTQTANEPVATQVATDNTEFIGEEKAEQIALEKAGLTADDVTFINIDLDRDDGVWQYELEFRQGTTEYEAEINAIDGKILKWEVDTK